MRHCDGILAVVAIKEWAQVARLLLVDMGRWGRNGGARVTHAIDVLIPETHRLLVAGFGIALKDTRVVEFDGSAVRLRPRV